MIKLFNTLTKTKDEFTPLDENNVGMYVCGPTVYSRAHIGNARSVVVFDVLYRVLRNHYGDNNVTYVRNITDVDDKINKAAKERGIEISELTTETTKMFHDDMSELNCLSPNIEPRATQNITGMVDLCEKLIESNNAYAAEGHVLFDITSFEKYGSLSRRTQDEMLAGARVEVAPYKKNAGDFVLWKPSNDDEPGWQSPWGRGRPGWHIECSVMSTKHLGDDFDIHGGGADLQFPHHENEIAQSCCANPKSTYARYWVHNGFLSVDGEKMSKSLGNFITLHDILSKYPSSGLAIRYALLATHYRKPLDWNEKARTDATKSINKFFKIITENELDEKVAIPQEFIDALNDDINTPKAIALMHEYAKNNNANTLYKCCQMLGLVTDKHLEIFKNNANSNIDNAEIKDLIKQRSEARKNKDWAESDRIRDVLKEKNITIKDNSDGSTSWS